MKDVYTVAEAAAILGVHPWTLRRATKPLAPFPRRGGKRTIPAARLAELADEIEQRRLRTPGAVNQMAG